MATTVTVLCPNGRRVNIKVTPATTLLQVLEQVCDKQKFDPAFHTLKHHNKNLDLSSLFRYTNLPQNAKMEMVATEKPRTESTEVTLAVQCEDGQRVQGKFDPSVTSLWGVLTKLGLCEFEGGRLEPVVAYMNNQICGEAALQKTTLRALGLTSGRAVVRLLFRERQTQDSSVGVCQPSQAEATPTGIRMELSSVSSGSAKEQSTLQGDSSEVREKTVSAEEEPMETHTAAAVDAGDDDQPRSKLSKAVPYSSQVKSSQSNISTPSQSGQTSSAGSTVRGAGDEEDMPYFPAHPFNYFPDDIKSSASRPPPPQRIGPVSMFDQQISLYAISEDESSVHVTTLEPFQFPAMSSTLQSRSVPQSPPKVYDEPCDRERVVYHLDTSLLSPSVEVPDEFFEVTVQDVQRIHDDHKKQLEAFSDAPLMTQAMKAAQMEKKYGRYDKAVIRVHFPDRWVLQGCFRPRESLKALVKFIRENLADPKVKFHLYTTPPKEVLKSGRITFIEAGFVPAAIVHVGVESSDAPPPVLSQDSLQQAQSGLEAEVIVAKKRELKHDSSSSSSTADQPRPKPHPPAAASGTSATSRAAATGSEAAGRSGGAGEARKIPKWFKVGK